MNELNSNISMNIFSMQHTQMNTAIQNQSQYKHNTQYKRKISHKNCTFRERKINEQIFQIKVEQSIGKLSYHKEIIQCKYAPIAFKYHKQTNSFLFKEYVYRFYKKSFEKIFFENKKMEVSQISPLSSCIEKSDTSQYISLQTPKLSNCLQSQIQLQKYQIIKEESVETPLQLLGVDQEQEFSHQNNSENLLNFSNNSQKIYQTMFEYLNKRTSQFHDLFSFNLTKNNDNQVTTNIPQSPLNIQDYCTTTFDVRLPTINLKKDEQQKFTDQINKIFKNFLNRDKQIRKNNIQLNHESQKTFKGLQKNEKEEQDVKLLIDSYDCEDDEDSEDNSEKNDDIIANQEIDNRLKQECIKEKCKDKRVFQNNNYVNDYEYNQKDVQIQQLSATEISKSTATITSLVLTQNKQSEIICGRQSAREILSQQTISVKPEQYLSSLNMKKRIPTNSCTSSQSKYHNLKNSFMHLIISLFNQKVLSCFDIPQIYIDYSIQIIKRMKNNSFKYRPIKGRYQYYSNIHYSTLFLKLMRDNLIEVKSCKQNLSFHEVFFKEDLSECTEMSDFSALKCNFFKLLIGQIVLFSLKVAQKNLAQYNEENNNKYLKSSRYFYINKVKKGIQKLQKGKHVIRF